MDFRLNFLGVTVCNFETSFKFYTEMLGMAARDTKPNWALFQTTGMTFELFGGGIHKGGESQTIIPSLHMVGAENFMETLSQKGVQFKGEIAFTQGVSSVEFIAPEGLRWRLIISHSSEWTTPFMAVPPPPEGIPRINAVSLMTGYDKFHQLRSFYEDLMGLSFTEGEDHLLRFGQGVGEPELLIFHDMESGKQRAPILTRQEAPHYLSFETGNIASAAEWLRSRKPRIIRDVTRHEWGGIDFQLLDPDNNPVQVVQYT